MSGISAYPGGVRRLAQLVGASTPSGRRLSQPFGCDIKPINAVSPSGQLQTMLNIAGAGAINIAAVTAEIGGTQALRLRVTLDGIVVVDRTMSFSTGTFTGIGYLFEAWSGSQVEVIGIQPHRCPFSTSCLVEVSTSFTSVSTGASLYVAYEVYE